MIKSGFFNSINGDRKYNAEDMSNYFEGLITNGIFENVGERFNVKPGGGMSVTVGSGRAMIECHWLKSNASVNFEISVPDVQYTRHDLIVIKLNYESREITLEKIEGKPNSLGLMPPHDDTETIKYLLLADIVVSPGATAIYRRNIRDYRGSEDCPWVTGLIKQVDTSQLFAQWQDAYQNLYESMEANAAEQYVNLSSSMSGYFSQVRSNVENWYNTLTETISVNAKLIKRQNAVKLTANASEVNIGIPEFSSVKDVLLVNVNGVALNESEDYNVQGTGSSAKITLTKPLTAGNTVTFLALRASAI